MTTNICNIDSVIFWYSFFRDLTTFINEHIDELDEINPSFKLTNRFVSQIGIEKEKVMEEFCKIGCFSDYEILYILPLRLNNTEARGADSIESPF